MRIIPIIKHLLLAACFSLIAKPALAHPHLWADFATSLIFNENKEITELKVTWKFDPLYSLIAIDGLDTDGDGIPEQKELLAMEAEALVGMKEYNYFTFITVDGDMQSLSEVSDFSISWTNEQLVLHLTVPLETPVNPRTHKFTYAIYDPFYYIELLHDPKDEILMVGAGAAGCDYQLERPEPTFEQLSQARALDVDQKEEGFGLGQYFAEYVTLNCSES